MKYRFSLILPTLLFSLALAHFCPASQTVEEIVQKDEKLLIAQKSSVQEFGQNNLLATIFSAQGGADYLEQELVLTQDDQLVVFGDIYLDEKTNVAELFPEKTRSDGRYYVFDFTLAELRGLTLTSPDGDDVPYLHISSYDEILSLIRTLEIKLAAQIGIYPKLIKTWAHKLEGKDLSAKLLYTLKSKGYQSRQDKVFIQSYDAVELQRMKETLMPMLQVDLPLVQLLGDNNSQDMQEVDGTFISPYNFDWMLSNFGLRSLATYADAVGLKRFRLSSTGEKAVLPRYIENLHKLGVKVHLNLVDDSDKLPGQELQNSLASQPEMADPYEWALYQMGASSPSGEVSVSPRNSARVKSKT